MLLQRHQSKPCTYYAISRSEAGQRELPQIAPLLCLRADALLGLGFDAGGRQMDTNTDIADGFDRDIAALKARAADYGAQHKVIDGIKWPNGMRMAVNFTADFDAMLLRRLLNEPPMQLRRASSAAGSASGG